MDLRTLFQQPHFTEGTQQQTPQTETMTLAEHADSMRKQHQHRQQAKATQELETLKASYRRRYLRTPGATIKAFERDWSKLLDNHHRAVALLEWILSRATRSTSSPIPAGGISTNREVTIW